MDDCDSCNSYLPPCGTSGRLCLLADASIAVAYARALRLLKRKVLRKYITKNTKKVKCIMIEICLSLGNHARLHA